MAPAAKPGWYFNCINLLRLPAMTLAALSQYYIL